MEDSAVATTNVDNGQLIEELLANTKGVSRGNQVLDRGETPMVMTVEDEGIVTVWERQTGRGIKVLRYMLPDLLKRSKNSDGSMRFTTINPGITPAHGILKCFLHPDGPNRAHYNELGLPVCKKENITAPYMVEMHMKKRHPSAWNIIDQERKAAKEQEERDFQRSLMTGRPQVAAATAPKKTWSRHPKNKKKAEEPVAKAPA